MRAKILQRSFIASIAGLLITATVTVLLVSLEREKALLTVNKECAHIKSRLAAAMSHSLAATSTLAFLVEHDVMGDRFDSVAHQLLGRSDFIDALQLVENDVIIITYPLEGNEPTIDYPALREEAHHKASEEARRRGSLFIEGPFDLHQGGVGFVGRRPIFKSDSLWGYAAVVIRRETFLAALGLNDSTGNGRFAYQITRLNGGEDAGRTVFEELGGLTGSIVAKEYVELGNWELTVQLNRPDHLLRAIPLAIAGLILTVLFVVLVRNLSMQPVLLTEKVKQKTLALQVLNVGLEEKTKALEASNADLEAFASVASHDLQEPLRMISSFLDLLKKRYGDSLDERATGYVDCAVDGAKSMRLLILDLLEYSRLGKSELIIEHFTLNQLLEEYSGTREHLIQRTNAVIDCTIAIEVQSSRSLLTQALFNLIDNALKYRKPRVSPYIKIAGV